MPRYFAHPRMVNVKWHFTMQSWCCNSFQERCFFRYSLSLSIRIVTIYSFGQFSLKKKGYAENAQSQTSIFRQGNGDSRKRPDCNAWKHRAWFFRANSHILAFMYIEKTRFLYYIKFIAVSYVFVKDFIVDVTSYKYWTNISKWNKTANISY